MEIIRRKGFSSRRTNLSQESTNFKIRQEEGRKQEPTAASRPPTTRSTPARRQPTMEKETPLPAVQTLLTTPSTIRHQRKPQTAEITPSPIIMRPTTPPPSPDSPDPDSPPPKKPRTKSPKTTKQPKEYFHVNIEEEYPLHEKYDIYATTHKVIVKASRQPREDEEINIDLPAYFVYQRENKHWLPVKGPTSKFFDDPWYTTIEILIEANSVQQKNTAYWYDVQEESCRDHLGDGGGPPLLRLVPPSYLGMTYSK